MRSPKILAAVILLLAVPVADLVLLFRVGKALGFWRTLGVISGTAVLGVGLLAAQGMTVFRQVERLLEAGRFPKRQIVDGVLVGIGGILLVLPGPLSDAVGIVLLFPLTRVLVRAALLRWIERYIYIDL